MQINRDQALQSAQCSLHFAHLATVLLGLPCINNRQLSWPAVDGLFGLDLGVEMQVKFQQLSGRLGSEQGFMYSLLKFEFGRPKDWLEI